MMNNLLLFAVTIILYKLVINFSRYIQCKQLLKRYEKYLKDPKWDFNEHTPKIEKLFRDANIDDSIIPVVEPVGYGKLRTSNASVIKNISTTRNDIAVLVTTKFHQAIGIYRSRMWDAINPLYWIEFLLMLPKQFLGYLGVKPESLVTKVAQLIYWLAGAVIGFFASVYKDEIDIAIKQFISQLLK